MSIFREVLETDQDVDESYLFAKQMAKQEEVDNKEKEHKSVFWATIVNILEQRLNIVQVREVGKDNL